MLNEWIYSWDGKIKNISLLIYFEIDKRQSILSLSYLNECKTCVSVFLYTSGTP